MIETLPEQILRCENKAQGMEHPANVSASDGQFRDRLSRLGLLPPAHKVGAKTKNQGGKIAGG